MLCSVYARFTPNRLIRMSYLDLGPRRDLAQGFQGKDSDMVTVMILPVLAAMRLAPWLPANPCPRNHRR